MEAGVQQMCWEPNVHAEKTWSEPGHAPLMDLEATFKQKVNAKPEM